MTSARTGSGKRALRGSQVNLRAGDRLRAELDARAGAASAIAARDLERYYALLARGRRSLLSVLDRQELAVCLDALNGVLHEAWSLPLVAEGIADAIRLDGADERPGVDGAALLHKLRAMDDAARWALVDAAERWWVRVAQGEQPDVGEAFR